MAAEELQRDDYRKARSGQRPRTADELLCRQEHPGDERKDVHERPREPRDHEQAEPVDGPAQESSREPHLQGSRQQEGAHRRHDHLHDRDHAQGPPERQHVRRQAERREDRRLHVTEIRSSAHDVGVPQRDVRQLGSRVLQEWFEDGRRIYELSVGADEERVSAPDEDPARYRGVPRRGAPQVVGGGSRVPRQQPGPEEDHCRAACRAPERRGPDGLGPAQQVIGDLPAHRWRKATVPPSYTALSGLRPLPPSRRRQARRETPRTPLGSGPARNPKLQ